MNERVAPTLFDAPTAEASRPRSNPVPTAGRFRPPALIVLACVCLVLNACMFGGYPTDRAAQATYHVQLARKAVEAGDPAGAGLQIVAALQRPSGDAQVRALFASHPQVAEGFAVWLQEQAVSASNIFDARRHVENLGLARAAAILPAGRMLALEHHAHDALATANRNGSLPLTLDDDLAGLTMLQTYEQRQIIVERTIGFLVEGTGPRALKGLMAHVGQVGADSAEGRRILALLPQMQIRRGELPLVAALAPNFVKTREAQLTTRVVLQLANGDRLLAADLRALLEPQTPGIVWLDAPNPALPTLMVERIRHIERESPERVHTIVYTPYEVYGPGARHMPHYAHYLYDIVTRSVSIEYGYAVTLANGGRTVHDELVRGQVGGDAHHCRDARIRNAYGGFARANFIANADMQARCASAPAPSIDELQTLVLGEVVRAIVAIPFVQASNELNF